LHAVRRKNSADSRSIVWQRCADSGYVFGQAATRNSERPQVLISQYKQLEGGVSAQQ
jgi:hypothetical protein